MCFSIFITYYLGELIFNDIVIAGNINDNGKLTITTPIIPYIEEVGLVKPLYQNEFVQQDMSYSYVIPIQLQSCPQGSIWLKSEN